MDDTLRPELEAGLKYIEEHTEIRDVLLSGGDDESSGGVLAPGETTRPTYGDDVQENRPVDVTGDPPLIIK